MLPSARWVRAAGVPTALVVGAGLLLGAPSDAAVSSPCLMRVNVERLASVTYANGVQANEYRVRVTWGSRSQTAEVHRLVMPPRVMPRLVTPKLGDLEPLRSQLDSRAGRKGLAAVNGDFFPGTRIDGQTVYLSRSASVSRGHPVRMGPTPQRVVGVDRRGKPFKGLASISGSVTQGRKSYRVDGVNWDRVGNGAAGIYTSAWDDVRDARRPAGAVEWVVRKDTVVDVRTGPQTGRTVARGTKVVAFGRDLAAAARSVRPGATVRLDIRQTTTGGVALQEAVGRSASLVDAGQVDLECSSLNLYPRPRNTVGWDANGRWMALTTPGSGYDRNGYRYGGLGLAQEANVAKALGFVEAAQLDGGGSTTVLVRRASGSWDRIDEADGAYQRPVVNSLVFVRSSR